MTTRKPPFWAFQLRLQTRNGKLMIAWPLASAPRAQALRKWLQAGRVEKGSVVFKEKLFADLLRVVDFPETLTVPMRRVCFLAHNEVPELKAQRRAELSAAWRSALEVAVGPITS